MVGVCSQRPTTEGSMKESSSQACMSAAAARRVQAAKGLEKCCPGMGSFSLGTMSGQKQISDRQQTDQPMGTEPDHCESLARVRRTAGWCSLTIGPLCVMGEVRG